MRRRAVDRLRRQRDPGFTLVEVLITIVVIALGLLGNASLLVRASRLNQGGVFRTSAVTFSQSIAERMEANTAGSLAGNYVVASGATITSLFDCTAVLCSAANLATYDLAAWQSAVRAVLPGATMAVARTSAAGVMPVVYRIQINWTEQRGSVKYATTGTSESFSYVATKTVFQ